VSTGKKPTGDQKVKGELGDSTRLKGKWNPKELPSATGKSVTRLDNEEEGDRADKKNNAKNET